MSGWNLPGERTDLPLAGVRVLDLTSTIAAPSATRVLADFGAQVIKVESATRPDTARLSSPYAGGKRGLNSSGYFSAYNAGKLSVSINLRNPAGVDIFRRLVGVSDVLVESFAPGVMARLGLDDDTLRSWNDKLIIAHHSLQGQSGRRSKQRGYGQLASAMTGWFEITGLPGEDPVGPYSAFTDFIAWPFLTAAVVLALELRDLGHPPAVIDHSHTESSAYFAAPELVASQLGSPPRRSGNSESYAAPCDAFPCKGEDAWCAIVAETEQQWLAVCEVLGCSTLAADERFSSLAARRKHEAELNGELSRYTRNFEAEDLATALRERGVPAARVLRAEDLFKDSQLAFRKAFHRVDHPVLGDHAVVAPAFRISGVESGPNRGFPLLGEHTEFVCREILQLSDQEVASYVLKGAFE